MKKIFVLLFLLFLTACGNSNISANLDNLFSSLSNIQTYEANNRMKYYSYYLPSDMGEEEVVSDSLTFKYGESTIVMNLNIPNIINEKYYTDITLSDDGFYNEDNLIYTNEGTYTVDETDKQYLYKLYDYGNYNALYLKTSDCIFYGNVSKGETKEVTRHLFIIAKSMDIEEDLVIADYSSKDTIDYQKKQIDLFNSTMPSSGSLEEMLTDEATIGNQPSKEQTSDNTNTDNSDNQSEAQ